VSPGGPEGRKAPFADDAALAARIDADRDRLTARLLAAGRRARRRADPDATHDVRVAARRLESLIDLWGGRRRRARRALAELRRALGPAREARVAITLLDARRGGLEPAAETAITLFLDRAERRLRRRERDAAKRCAGGSMRALARAVDRALRRGLAGGTVPGRDQARERLEARRERALRRMRSAAALADDARLHAARIAIKRWRYGLERIAAVDPESGAGAREALVALQHELGGIQDLALLRANVETVAARLRAHGATAGAEALARLEAILARERGARVEAFQRLAAGAAFTEARVLSLPPLERGA
jgi:CHAD domain-containing protein